MVWIHIKNRKYLDSKRIGALGIAKQVNQFGKGKVAIYYSLDDVGDASSQNVDMLGKSSRLWVEEFKAGEDRKLQGEMAEEMVAKANKLIVGFLSRLEKANNEGILIIELDELLKE